MARLVLDRAATAAAAQLLGESERALEMSVEYAARARAGGDLGTECTLLPGAGHFDVIDPLSAAWGTVEHAFRSAWPPG